MKLSACLMVKNEEANLERCLRSICKLAQEIIVVDTGSTDKTVEIAEKFGAKVYYHPWERDFSLHRNQSISYATGDWILIIDADEEFIINGTNPTAIRKWLFEVPNDINAAGLVLNDIQKQRIAVKHNTARFFRRGQIYYKNVIHNHPVIGGDTNAKVMLCPNVYLKHYGYDLSPAQKEAKRKRTITLLHKRLRENPDDYQVLFLLSQSYAWHGSYEKSVKYGIRYTGCKEQLGESFNSSIYATMISVYAKLGNKEKTREWLLVALEDNPENLDTLFAATKYGVWSNDLALMAKSARRYIDNYEKFDQETKGNTFVYNYTLEAKAFCLQHLALAQLQEGAYTLTRFLETLPLLAEDIRKKALESTLRKLKILGINPRGIIERRE